MSFMSEKRVAPIIDGLALGLMEIEEEPEAYGVGTSPAKRQFKG